jgi:hypothetical protein
MGLGRSRVRKIHRGARRARRGAGDGLWGWGGGRTVMALRAAWRWRWGHALGGWGGWLRGAPSLGSSSVLKARDVRRLGRVAWGEEGAARGKKSKNRTRPHAPVSRGAGGGNRYGAFVCIRGSLFLVGAHGNGEDPMYLSAGEPDGGQRAGMGKNPMHLLAGRGSRESATGPYGPWGRWGGGGCLAGPRLLRRYAPRNDIGGAGCRAPGTGGAGRGMGRAGRKRNSRTTPHAP